LIDQIHQNNQIETLETLRLRLRGAFLAVRRDRHANVRSARAARGSMVSAEQEAGAQDSIVFFAWQVLTRVLSVGWGVWWLGWGVAWVGDPMR